MSNSQLSPIRSLSQEAVNMALDEVRDKFDGTELLATDSKTVLSDCIASLGGLFARVEVKAQPKDWWFFRVRKRSTFSSEEELLDPKQYSYLPAEHTKIAGRCHLPHNPIFYGSDSFDGAIDEMQDQTESEYMLSIWRLPLREIRLLKFLCGSNIKESSRLYEHKKKILADACDQQDMHDELNGGRLKAHIVAWLSLIHI